MSIVYISVINCKQADGKYSNTKFRRHQEISNFCSSPTSLAPNPVTRRAAVPDTRIARLEIPEENKIIHWLMLQLFSEANTPDFSDVSA